MEIVLTRGTLHTSQPKTEKIRTIDYNEIFSTILIPGDYCNCDIWTRRPPMNEQLHNGIEAKRYCRPFSNLPSVFPLLCSTTIIAVVPFCQKNGSQPWASMFHDEHSSPLSKPETPASHKASTPKRGSIPSRPPTKLQSPPIPSLKIAQTSKPKRQEP